MNPMQFARNRLVALGPESALFRMVAASFGRLLGVLITFNDNIEISNDKKKIIISKNNFIFIPYVAKLFSYYHKTFEPKLVDGWDVLDFSGPGVHKYRRSGEEFAFPNIPEDDSIIAYTHSFKPSTGMTIWDVGALAGATACAFSRAVGPAGRVYAFEPDETSRHFLELNIQRHGLHNVTVVREALGPRTGRSRFNMDKTLSAGLVEYLTYPNTGQVKEVDTITIEDFCRRTGGAPDFIKMDIEGAEVAVIESSLEFLKACPIHFAIESEHKGEDGNLTCASLEKLFTSIGYESFSKTIDNFVFTFGSPR